MYHKTKQKVHGLLHPEIVGDKRWDKIINIFIVVLIVLNVIAVIIETLPAIEQSKTATLYFHYFDVVSVIIFSLEYVLRVWSSNHEEKYKHPVWGRLKYMLSPAALIDLVAILPFYVNTLFRVKLELRELRMLRLLRFFRLFRLTAYTKSAHLILNVFKKRINELGLSFILAIFLIIIASCMLYFAEHQYPSVAESHFKSIPDTIWWAIVSLTTTGYGDMVPLTSTGKIMASVIMLTGIAFFALPAGIITAGFIDEFRNERIKKTHRCPNCGEHIELDDNGNTKHSHS